MFQFFPSGFSFPFMSLRFPTAILSLALVATAGYFIATKGLNYGVDFAGGVQIVVGFSDKIEMDEERLRTTLKDMGYPDASVQRFGTEIDADDKQEFVIHFSGSFADEAAAKSLFETAFADLSTDSQSMLENFRFSGMEKAYFRLSKNIDFSEVEKRVKAIPFDMMKLEGVAPFGSSTSREYEVRFRGIASEVESGFREQLKENADALEIQKVDFVGAKVGKDLKLAALMSVLVTILLVFVYVFIRFDLVYAPGVILALAHDVIITTGLFSLLGIEFDLTVVAALLTVAGYSINDTIIVYDRIREMVGDLKGKKFRDILDIAISQTMNRTIITSGTTVLVTAILFIFGGPVIHSFALALTFGIFVGTYSSIFVASTLVLWVDEFMKRREQAGKRKHAA